jgi:hypothetical protein
LRFWEKLPRAVRKRESKARDRIVLLSMTNFLLAEAGEALAPEAELIPDLHRSRNYM